MITRLRGEWTQYSELSNWRGFICKGWICMNMSFFFFFFLVLSRVNWLTISDTFCSKERLKEKKNVVWRGGGLSSLTSGHACGKHLLTVLIPLLVSAYSTLWYSEDPNNRGGGTESYLIKFFDCWYSDFGNKNFAGRENMCDWETI